MLGFLNAALSISGVYAVAGDPLDQWMLAAIDEYQRTAEQPALSGLALHLRDRLSIRSEANQRRAIHIAGYVTEGTHSHPEVFYLRNIRGRAPDGGYGRPGREFMVSEEFWSDDYPKEETRDAIATGGARMYLDGFPENRIAYMLLHQRIHDFYHQVWQTSTRFLSPRSLEDIASLVELDMRVNATFLGPGGYRSRHASDSLEIETIPSPPNAVKL